MTKKEYIKACLKDIAIKFLTITVPMWLMYYLGKCF